jgi:hypothetical protein
MTVRRGIVPLLVLCALALPTAPAAAAPDTVPPDNSAAAQYTEALPGAEGNRPSKALREKRGETAPEGALSKKEVRRLKALGKEGADAAELAAAGADGGAAGGGAAGGQGGGASSDRDGSSGPGQILNAVTGFSDDGIGLLAPLLIALAMAAALAYAVARRRSAASAPRQ